MHILVLEDSGILKALNGGGVLPPYMKEKQVTGTVERADVIYQNINSH